MINSFGYLLYFRFALPVRLPTVLSYLEQFSPAPDVPALSHQTLAPYGRSFLLPLTGAPSAPANSPLIALPPAGSSEGQGTGEGRPKNQDRGAPSDHPRTRSVDQGTETRRDPGIQPGRGEARLGVEVVIDSTKDAGGSFKSAPLPATSVSWPACC